MARVKLFGQEFSADLVKQVAPTATGEAQWQAIARAHTGRTVPGTTIIVKQSEIIEAAAAELPTADSPAPQPAASATPSNEGLSELEAAMAKERETLPSPKEIIAQRQKQAAERRAQEEAVSVSPGPTQRPAGRQQRGINP